MQIILNNFFILVLLLPLMATADERAVYLSLKNTGELGVCDGLTAIEKSSTKSVKKVEKISDGVLWLFTCPAGAYNAFSALIFESKKNLKNKQVLSFVIPQFSDDGRTIGLQASIMVPELSFEKKEDGVIEFKSLQRIRSVGDLYELAIFEVVVRDCCSPQIILKRYERDLTKDAEKNPEILFEFKKVDAK